MVVLVSFYSILFYSVHYALSSSLQISHTTPSGSSKETGSHNITFGVLFQAITKTLYRTAPLRTGYNIVPHLRKFPYNVVQIPHVTEVIGIDKNTCFFLFCFVLFCFDF